MFYIKSIFKIFSLPRTLAHGRETKYCGHGKIFSFLIIVVCMAVFSPIVFMVMGDGRTYIGKEKVVGTHSDALLQVAGKAAAKSFYVLKPTTRADEVFENKEIPHIKEIENFIKTHKHLPEIPSEKDVTENGYDVHEMNRLLLKKIEELYLIVIEQGKEIDELKKKK
jgi:hypothetical protein